MLLAVPTCPIYAILQFMKEIIAIKHLNKTYANNVVALGDITLSINRGEIFALLGPNGAGKTTLINAICGLVQTTSGTITIDGYDHKSDYRKARAIIGLVPQELFLDPFLTVLQTLTYQRGLFGKKPDQKLLHKTLKSLSLWDKRNQRVRTLSGGMKRRVLIGKALMNEPKVLFLDEPTAGVDIELRRGMWDLVWQLKKSGTTIILTTHYLEEAQEMADRIGIITNGDLKLVERKETLMQQLGKKSLVITLRDPLQKIPQELSHYHLTYDATKNTLTYTYDIGAHTGITALLSDLKAHHITIADLTSKESSLEDIFVELINEHQS